MNIEELANQYAIEQCEDMFNNIGLSGAQWGWETALDFKAGYQKAKETFIYTEEDMIKFAEFVAKYPDKDRNVYGNMLHAKSKYDGAETTISLLELWKNETQS